MISLIIYILAVTIESHQLGATFLLVILGISFVKVIIFAIFGVYKSLLTTGGISVIDMIKIGLLSLFTNGVACAMFYIFSYNNIDIKGSISWQMMIFVVIAEIFAMVFIRYLRRIIKVFKREGPNSKRTLLVGAGLGAKLVFDEIVNNPLFNNKVVAFIDDDPHKIGKRYLGKKIYGPISDAHNVITNLQIEEVIITIGKLSNVELKRILDMFSKENVRIKRLPILSEMGLQENNSSGNIQDVSLNDLLGRNPVIFNSEEIKKSLEGSTVLVTGAGGSIGSELSRQIFVNNPKRLVLFDIYENGVYTIEQELKTRQRNGLNPTVELFTLIGATYDKDTLDRIFRKYGPIDYIYHAAAYKHVPLMEFSPNEAIRSNVLGTYNVCHLANEYKAKKVVIVSTDKAVRPTNVMGATKRCAEIIMEEFAKLSNTTLYCAVRFGNVLGSNGSVIPLFMKQIREGGPITVTDPRITRFFMTIPEATSLILESGSYAKKGEIFVLDMGKPVKIVDLANNLIRQQGLVPNKDIKIIFTGLRPGEKLYEELLVNKETMAKTENNLIFIEEEQSNRSILDLGRAIALIKNDDIVLIKEELMKLIGNK